MEHPCAATPAESRTAVSGQGQAARGTLEVFKNFVDVALQDMV